MEIKTTNDIKDLRNPYWHDESEEGERKSLDFNNVKWVKVEDVLKKIQEIKEMKIDAEDFVQELGGSRE